MGQPKHTRTSLTADVWAGTQSRRHTAIHGCNKSAQLFLKTQADKQCLSSTIRGRNSAALSLTSSTATNGIVPNFCSHALHISNMPCHRQKAFHVFLASRASRHGLSLHEEHLGACRQKVNPRGLSFLPRCSKHFFSFPQTLAWSRRTSDRASTRG